MKNSWSLLVAMKTNTATMENSTDVSQNINMIIKKLNRYTKETSIFPYVLQQFSQY
jgi:hypothetical protein